MSQFGNLTFTPNLPSYALYSLFRQNCITAKKISNPQVRQVNALVSNALISLSIYFFYTPPPLDNKPIKKSYKDGFLFKQLSFIFTQSLTGFLSQPSFSPFFSPFFYTHSKEASEDLKKLSSSFMIDRQDTSLLALKADMFTQISKYILSKLFASDFSTSQACCSLRLYNILNFQDLFSIEAFSGPYSKKLQEELKEKTTLKAHINKVSQKKQELKGKNEETIAKVENAYREYRALFIRINDDPKALQLEAKKMDLFAWRIKCVTALGIEAFLFYTSFKQSENSFQIHLKEHIKCFLKDILREAFVEKITEKTLSFLDSKRSKYLSDKFCDENLESSVNLIGGLNFPSDSTITLKEKKIHREEMRNSYQQTSPLRPLLQIAIHTFIASIFSAKAIKKDETSD